MSTTLPETLEAPLAEETPAKESAAAMAERAREPTVPAAPKLPCDQCIYERLLDATPESMIATDEQGAIIYLNAPAARLLKVEPAQVLGHELPRYFSEASAVSARALLAECLKLSPDATLLGEHRTLELVDAGGVRVPVLASGAPLRSGAFTRAGALLQFSDLRERNVEKRLTEAEKRAIIVEMAGAAAHELNQPLTSVMGFAELLKRRLPESDPAHRQVDIIYREAERIAEIVRKLGKITKYETKDYVGGQRIVDISRSAGEKE